MTPATKKVINAFISGLAILVTMFVVSIFIRFQDINNDKGIANIEATYHSLLIIESIADRPLSEHFLLPIVTPGGKVNENIPWGATVPTAKGGYIYTSFPSLGYIAPLLFIKTLHLDYSLKSLVAFNLFVQIVAAIILYLALCMAFHADNKKSYIFASLSCVTLFFSREALASTGLLYWPQSLSQLFIALFMLGVTLRIHGKSKSGFFVAWFSVFLLTLTEWTGVTLGGVAFLYFLISRKNRDTRFSVAMAVAVVVALLIYLLQLYLAINLHDFITASVARFAVRSGANAHFLDLLSGYIKSFSLFLLIVPFAMITKFITKNNNNRTIEIIIWLSSLLMVENLLLAQHAISYTFDRLKLTFLLSILICYIFMSCNRRTRLLAVLLIIVSGIISIKDYRRDVQDFASWSAMKDKNQALASEILKINGFNCASIFDNTRVRAYLNILIHRSVWERLPTESELMADTTGECPVIVINGEIPFKDLQRITSVDIFRHGVKTQTLQ